MIFHLTREKFDEWRGKLGAGLDSFVVPQPDPQVVRIDKSLGGPGAWENLNGLPAPKPPVPRAATPARERTGPGDVVKAVLDKLGYGQRWDCGCAAMQQRMNAWGWRGCFRNRSEIVAWFVQKAADVGVKVDGNGVWALLRAAWKDLRRKKPT